jgi:hypothetical protein
MMIYEQLLLPPAQTASLSSKIPSKVLDTVPGFSNLHIDELKLQGAGSLSIITH